MIKFRWPFTRVTKPTPAVPVTPEPVKEFWRDQWDILKKIYVHGTMFPFCNANLVVVGYSYSEDRHGMIHPVMHCAYRDSGGVLHEWTFDEHNLPLLLQKEPVKK